MKKITIYLTLGIFGLFLIQACGESTEEETVVEQPAEQESMEVMYQQELEQMRRDSIEQARLDSIAAAEDLRNIEFSENGPFAVQIEAWRSESKAEQQKKKWIERGYENAYVVEYGNAETGDLWYRVRIGHFDSREMADRFRIVLSEDYNTRSWVSGPVKRVHETQIAD